MDGIISNIHTHKSIKFTDEIEKQDCRNSNQKSTKILWTAIFHMVFACVGWIYNERYETSR